MMSFIVLFSSTLCVWDFFHAAVCKLNVLYFTATLSSVVCNHHILFISLPEMDTQIVSKIPPT